MSAYAADILSSVNLSAVCAIAHISALSADNSADVVPDMLIAYSAAVCAILQNTGRISRNAAHVGYICCVFGRADFLQIYIVDVQLNLLCVCVHITGIGAHHNLAEVSAGNASGIMLSVNLGVRFAAVYYSRCLIHSCNRADPGAAFNASAHLAAENCSAVISGNKSNVCFRSRQLSAALNR